MHPKLQQLAATINAAHAANEQGNFKEAEQLCKKTLKADKTIPEAWYNLGLALRGLHHKKEAIRAQREALKLTKDSADAQNSIGLELLELGEQKDAETALRRALRIDPNHAFAHSNLGKLFTAQKKHTEALVASENAYQLLPDHPKILVNLGASLNAINKHKDAENFLRKAIMLNPSLSEAFNNLAGALSGQNRHKEAIEAAQASIKINPEKLEPMISLSSSLESLGNTSEAEKVIRAALEIDGKDPEINNNFGHLLFGQSRFAEGWPHYEYRFNTTKEVAVNSLPNIPTWNGNATGHVKLVVHAEQGIGDEVLYAAFLQKLDEHKFNQPITVTADKRLISIYERSFPNLRFLDRKETLNPEEFNAQIPLASLGKFFLSDKDDFAKTKHPLLKMDIQLSNELREKINQKDCGKICGISWRSKSDQHGECRSMRLEDLEPILSLKNIQFINLQYGQVDEDIEDFKKTTGIEILQISEIDNFGDIDGLLSLINACDFIVTASNVTTHLAGAIGKHTYQIDPKGNGKFWYWKNLSQDGYSLWYPSVKIYEQKEIGDWQSPIEQLSQEIKEGLLLNGT